jgi:hypothetical protein
VVCARPMWSRYVLATCLCASSGFFLWLSWVVAPKGVPLKDVELAAFFSVLCLAGSIFMLVSRRLRWDREASALRFEYGFLGQRRVRLDFSQLRAELRCQSLVLMHKRYSDGVVVAESRERSRLLPLFDALRGVLGDAAEDRTSVAGTSAEGLAFETVRCPIANHSLVGLSRPSMASPDEVVFRPAAAVWYPIGSSLLLACLIGAFAVLAAREFAGATSIIAMVPGAVVLTLLWDACLLLRAALQVGRMSLSKDRGILTISSAGFGPWGALDRDESDRRRHVSRLSAVWKQSGHFSVAMSDIAGVQMCEGEVNLILLNPQGARVHLASPLRDDVQSCAGLISDFLGMPVFDHRTAEAVTAKEPFDLQKWSKLIAAAKGQPWLDKPPSRWARKHGEARRPMDRTTSMVAAGIVAIGVFIAAAWPDRSTTSFSDFVGMCVFAGVLAVVFGVACYGVTRCLTSRSLRWQRNRILLETTLRTMELSRADIRIEKRGEKIVLRCCSAEEELVLVSCKDEKGLNAFFEALLMCAAKEYDGPRENRG